LENLENAVKPIPERCLVWSAAHLGHVLLADDHPKYEFAEIRLRRGSAFMDFFSAMRGS
jgi:hypothetical protein